MASTGAFKIASLLLQYPDDARLGARAAIGDGIEELGGGRVARALRDGWERWSALDAADLRARYVDTFDFNRHNSLYLTYHTHGDRRERGMALVELKHRFSAAGLPLETEELPDYLPLLLEFAELAPEHGVAILVEYRPALEVLRTNLVNQQSLWELPLKAVCAALPRMTRRQRAKAEQLRSEGPPDELVGLEPFAPPEFMPPAQDPAAPYPSQTPTVGGAR